MDSEKLTKAISLNQEIKELKYFIETVLTENKGAHNYCSSFINIETTKKIQLFGSRYFGIGSHNSNIIIPRSLLSGLVELAKKHLSEIENEYENIETC